MPDHEVAVVSRYADVMQAEFARSVLAGSGVEAFLDVPYTGGLFPHYVMATGWVSLLVRAADLERARDILAASDAPGGDAVV